MDCLNILYLLCLQKIHVYKIDQCLFSCEHVKLIVLSMCVCFCNIVFESRFAQYIVFVLTVIYVTVGV